LRTHGHSEVSSHGKDVSLEVSAEDKSEIWKSEREVGVRSRKESRLLFLLYSQHDVPSSLVD